ncbi:hypothetical protein K6U40_14670 [Vibrio fluvialis]|uniref:hypothetical protein n=1 Tax=Vibrio fluvialis TaxID=676 RepID=UPI001EEBF400|nr:hypothetical protein [Vibrio fluvialis]
MSGTASKTSARKPRAAKSTTGPDQETVAASDSQSQAKAEQDEKLKQEAEAQAKAQEEAQESAKVQENVADDVEAEQKAEADAEATEDKPDESDSEKQEEPVESDKPEQSATTADSDQSEKGSDDDGQLDPTKDADGATGGNDSVLGILGAFKVRAKSAQGFWRSGVQFLRTKETIVLVVDEEPKDQPEIVAQEGIEHELVLFMSKEKARRVHQEPNLVVEDVELSEVLDLENMAQ